MSVLLRRFILSCLFLIVLGVLFSNEARASDHSSIGSVSQTQKE
ncbi:hypothetical protein [Shewanella surugensis]|nr:hypothetical protein [Shewanella surugensis]